MLLFASLVCHRDCEIFKFNWFSSRINLDHGFDIPHLVLNDGSLTAEDIKSLKELPNLFLEETPVHLYDVPKAVYLAKIECFNIGFNKYNAEKVVIIDSDVFFFKNWEADLRKICMSKATVLRDWCSSLGPNVDQFKQIFGIHEDQTTPNCNTGIFAISRDQHFKIQKPLDALIKTKVMMMEDQCCAFVAFYGALSYIEGIKVLVNGGEDFKEIRDWVEVNRGCHLVGMRTRPAGLEWLKKLSVDSWKDIKLSQITPNRKFISWGLLEYDTYDFTKPLATFPSKHEGIFINNGLFIHGGSWVNWDIPKQFSRFTCKIICADTGKKNSHKILINDKEFIIGDTVDIGIAGILNIKTVDAPGSHLVFLDPMLRLK